MSDLYICNECRRTFTRKYNLMTHMQNCHLKQQNKCEICSATFVSQSSLQSHYNNGHNTSGLGIPECDICRTTFRRKSYIVTHMLTKHSQGISFNCKTCSKVFSSKKELKRHEDVHSDSMVLICDVCKNVFHTKLSLIAHIDSKHSEVSGLVCHMCRKSFSSSRNLKRHLQLCNSDKIVFSCDVCSREFNLKQSLFRHKKVCLSERNEWECNLCTDTFKLEPLLRNHVKVRHSFADFYKYCKDSLLNEAKSKVVYKTCNICFVKLPNETSYKQHKITCIVPENVNSCLYCERLFTDLSSLEFHVKIFHADVKNLSLSTNNVAVYNCMYCERVYYSDRSLKHHIKLKHTTNTKVDCDICGKVCSNKYYLASHKKIVHNNSLVLKCNYCSKEFKSRRNIRRHIECTHLGMQRYKCMQCQTLFKEKRSLRKHIRTKHSESKIFPSCHVCKKLFESAKSCKIHLKLMHSVNLNNYPCHLCPEYFTDYVSLKTHLEKKHSDDKIFKCDSCNLIFNGQDKFDTHLACYHTEKQETKLLPRCILCLKDFSTRKTLKRHIKNFHPTFNVDSLADYGTEKRNFVIDCEHCLEEISNEDTISLYNNLKSDSNSIVFKCGTCSRELSCLEISIQQYKECNDVSKSVLSELCMAEISEGEVSNDLSEALFDFSLGFKSEPLSP